MATRAQIVDACDQYVSRLTKKDTDGIVALYDPNATVEAVHGDVDKLERAARVEFPEIARIIGHAEPG